MTRWWWSWGVCGDGYSGGGGYGGSRSGCLFLSEGGETKIEWFGPEHGMAMGLNRRMCLVTLVCVLPGVG